MRILDHKGNEVKKPDLKKGHVEHDRVLVKHHEAVEAVPEKGHWKSVAEYPNGGKDVEWVIDVPGVERKEAWDEYEDVLRYVEHTPSEPSLEIRVERLEQQMATLVNLVISKGGE